jgi:predicted lipid-binding transport protein (Tim44 family)
VLFVTVILLLSTTLSLQGAFAQGGGTMQAPAKPKMADTHTHPEIHQAMQALENAKKHLEGAVKDYGGHKAKAIDHVDQAMNELREALKFAESEGH